MTEPIDVLSDGISSSSLACMFGTGSIYGTERVDRYLCLIHSLIFKQFLLTQFVCLYSYNLFRLVTPTVAPSSAGCNIISQLIKSLGSRRQHGKRARRPEATHALRNSLSRILGATPIQDQEKR